MRALATALASLVSGLLLLGCGAELTGESVPNAPPDTRIATTSSQLAPAPPWVGFHWTGTDLDGEVAFFELRLSDNGADGRVDIGDTLARPWVRTTSRDSVLSVSADLDSFPADLGDPAQDRRTWRYWQTHTLFVRAVDAEGARDPSPASISFTATTIAPTVVIEAPPPVTTNSCEYSSRSLTFRWRGEDIDDPSGVPAAVRFALVDLADLGRASCFSKLEYERSNPVASLPAHAWSPWIAYDAPADSGVSVTFPTQPLGMLFLFAVQARDQAGAVTPTFEWGQNVRHVTIAGNRYPTLAVIERYLGTAEFSGAGGLKQVEVVAGQPLQFSWIANATDYAGIIQDYRYGWSIQDFSDPNDPGWAVSWGNGPAWRASQVRTFQSGSPNFVVQTRDNSGVITRAVYQIDVVQPPDRARQRELVLLQDWNFGSSQAEQILEADWERRWLLLFEGHVPGFSHADLVNGRREGARFQFRTLTQYKSAIWFLNGGSADTWFRKLLAPAASGTLPYQWLEVYQARVGNLLFVGPNAAFAAVERLSSGGAPWQLPLVFSTPESGTLGLGVSTTPEGVRVTVGTTRWPYAAWCLEAADYVRPAPGDIFGEDLGAENQKRTRACDGLARAVVDADFLALHPSAVGTVTDLRPNDERGAAQRPEFRFEREEFYNTNVTVRPVTILPRPCQQVMFRLRARRDEGFVASPITSCYPFGRPLSPLHDVPVAVASTVHSQTKPLEGSEDFLWGFHPLAFETDDVRRALWWILGERWQIPVR